MMPVDSAFSRSAESKCDSGDGRVCSKGTAHPEAWARAVGPAPHQWRWPTPGARGALGAAGTVGTVDPAELAPAARCRMEKDTGAAWHRMLPRTSATCRVRV